MPCSRVMWACTTTGWAGNDNQGGSLDIEPLTAVGAAHLAGLDLTRYGGYRTPRVNPSPSITRSQNEFGISVGILYRFKMGKGPQFDGLIAERQRAALAAFCNSQL